MEMIYYRGDHDLGDASSNAINTQFKAAKAGAGTRISAESGQRRTKLTPDGVHKIRR